MAPLAGVYRLNRLVLDREAAIQGPSQLAGLLPGLLGNQLRRGFYRSVLQACSGDCAISFGTIFSTPNCEIGRHVYIGAYCVISDCAIGDDTLLGSQVHIISGKHAHGFDPSETPMRLQKTSRQPVRIGRDAWIGNGAIVMADVGDGCVVGAGSVVTKPIPPYSIAAGNPARILRSRADRPSPTAPTA